MNDEQIKDVCREFGWREVGELHRLEDWLRERLTRLETLERMAHANPSLDPDAEDHL